MFIGHLAVGFAAKRFAPKADLGWLLLSSELIDLLFFGLFLLGWEQMRIEPGHIAATPLVFDNYPWSHSLAGSLLCAAAASAGYWLLTRYGAGAAATFAAVASHWFLDALSHGPDLPFYPGGSFLVGLGLWKSLPGTLLVEGALFLAGAVTYFSLGHARDRIGSYGAISFIAVVLMLYAGGTLGPPPPSIAAVGISGLAMMVVLPAWASWIDRHRTAPERHRT